MAGTDSESHSGECIVDDDDSHALDCDPSAFAPAGPQRRVSCFVAVPVLLARCSEQTTVWTKGEEHGKWL